MTEPRRLSDRELQDILAYEADFTGASYKPTTTFLMAHELVEARNTIAELEDLRSLTLDKARTWLDDIRDYTARECLTDDEWATLLSLAYDGQMFRDLNEKGHVVEFDEGGYGLEHPATCRIEGRLLDCPVEIEIRSLSANPFGEPGRYRVILGASGVLEGWKLPGAPR